MSIIAEFTIPADALPGGETLAEFPNARLELERIVPTQDAVFPFFWVWCDDADTFLEQAQFENRIDDITILTSLSDGALFQATWAPDADIILGIKRLQATILEATATSDEWRLQVRAQSRTRFNQFQNVFAKHGIPVELERLYSLSELVEGQHQPLTDEQRETLITAYRDGYYDEPRRTNQQALGNHFGVSARAISNRLRRGTANLIASSLTISPPEVDSE